MHLLCIGLSTVECHLPALSRLYGGDIVRLADVDFVPAKRVVDQIGIPHCMGSPNFLKGVD